MADQRIHAADSVWLGMDRPNNLMVIEALILLDRPVDAQRFTTVLRDRLVNFYPVFRQRPRSRTPFGVPRWSDDAAFAMERHIHRTTLAPPGDDVDLGHYLAEQMSRPLDRAHPLWEVHLIDGYRGGGAVLCRLHHAMADGVTLARLLMSLTDGTPDQAATPKAGPADEMRGHLPRVVRIGCEAVTAAASVACGTASVVRRVAGRAGPALVGELAGQAAQAVGVLNKLVLGHNPPNPLGREPGPAKLVAWSQPLSLAAVRSTGRTSDATVNDVLMSALAGAISTYLSDHGHRAVDLSTMVPIDLRPREPALSRHLGNRFALAFLPLPISVAAAEERLAETKRRMDAIKHSPEAAITFTLLNAVGWLHPAVERLIVDFFARKAVGVTTNVIGPGHPRFLAGSRIEGVLAWVPGSGRQTLGVCIVSYNDTVRVGFKVDAATLPDPVSLVDAFQRQLEPQPAVVSTV